MTVAERTTNVRRALVGGLAREGYLVTVIDAHHKRGTHKWVCVVEVEER